MKDSVKQDLYVFYKAIRRFVKHNKTIFSIYRHLTDKDYQREKRKMTFCTVKSKEQICAEMKAYSKYWGCNADDYVRYGLFEKDLPMEEILDYVPMQYYYCNYADETTKGINIWKADDKWLEYLMFKERNIPTPEVIALVKNNSLFTCDNQKMQWKRLCQLVYEGERIFFKPIDGNCGNGIVVIIKKQGKIIKNDKEVECFKDLGLKNGTGYIVQRGLKQCSELMKMNSSSLNTLRTIVKYDKNGHASIGGILLRIGRVGSVVDNSGQGGISVEVNINDGSLGEYAGREHGGGKFPMHPDTGFVFKGAKIGDWDNIIIQIRDIISKVTEYKTIGWDIAIGEDKVYAIELNLGWGIEHAQVIAGGFRRRMGIYPK